jgi:magnesium transporter
MLIRTFYNSDGSSGREIAPDEIAGILHADTPGLVWVDATDPSEEEIAALAKQFGFHPLAVDDLKEGKHRPKIVEYRESVFLIVHELRPAPGHERLDRPCVELATELRIFVGQRFLVTLHERESDAVKTARERWEAAGELQKLGPYFLLYLILDSLVDEYFPSMDVYDDRIEELEQLVLKPADEEVSVIERGKTKDDARKPLQVLLSLRRELLEKRRSVAPLRDAVNVLLRRAESLSGSNDGDPARIERARALFAYFQDIYDHTIRIVDTLDTYRDLLAGTLDAHLAVASNRLNEIVKVLTSVSIILMTWGFITGVYGMNFQDIPELHWRHGYPYVIGLFIITGVVEWIYFRRRKWL